MKHVPTTRGTAEVDVMDDRCSDTQVGGQRVMYTNPSFVRANPHHVRGRKPTGSGAAWSLTLKRGPDGRFLFGSTCELSSGELSHYCGDRRVYSTRMRTCVLDHHYRLVLASRHLATHHPGGRIAGGCVTGTAHVVGSAWHTGCRSER
jgi:hypothetical protein